MPGVAQKVADSIVVTDHAHTVCVCVCVFACVPVCLCASELGRASVNSDKQGI